MTKLRRLVALSAILLMAGCGDPEGEANALYVEAATSVAAAQAAAPGLSKYEALSAADAKIGKILADYPKTAAAVRIAANEKVGPLTRAELTAAIQKEAEHPAVCRKNPTAACIGGLVFAGVRERGPALLREPPSVALVLIAQRLGLKEIENELMSTYIAGGRSTANPQGTEPYFAGILARTPQAFWTEISEFQKTFPGMNPGDAFRWGLTVLQGPGSPINAARAKDLIEVAAAKPGDGRSDPLSSVGEAILSLHVPEDQKRTLQQSFMKEAIGRGRYEAIPVDMWREADANFASALLADGPANLAAEKLPYLRNVPLEDIKRLAERGMKQEPWAIYASRGSTSLPIGEIIAAYRRAPSYAMMGLIRASFERLKADPQGARALAAAAEQASRGGKTSLAPNPMAQAAVLLTSQGITPATLKQVEQKIASGELQLYGLSLEAIVTDFPQTAPPDWLLRQYAAWMPHAGNGSQVELWLSSMVARERLGSANRLYTDAQLAAFATTLCWKRTDGGFSGESFIRFLVHRGFTQEAEAFAGCNGAPSEYLASAKIERMVLEGQIDHAVATVTARPPAERSRLIKALPTYGPLRDNMAFWQRLIAAEPETIFRVYETADTSVVEEAYRLLRGSPSQNSNKLISLQRELTARYVRAGSKEGLTSIFFDANAPDVQIPAALALIDLYTQEKGATR